MAVSPAAFAPASAATFRVETQSVLCQRCGASVAVVPQAGTATCAYCGAVHELRMRPEAVLRAAASGGDPERLARLRAQDGRAPVPPSLLTLVTGGVVPEAKAAAALALWQELRAALRAAPTAQAAEEFMCLTAALSERFLADRDPGRQRALLDTALGLLTHQRHQQLVRAHLAGAACVLGDLEAAESWLATADPRPEDLQSDTAWRFARACIDTARGRPGQVLRVLGSHPHDVPLSNLFGTECAVLRAHAWESLAQGAMAVDLLLELKQDGGPGARLRAQRFMVTHAAWRLCAASEPIAAQRFAALRLPIAAHRNVVLQLLAATSAWALLTGAAALLLVLTSLLFGGPTAWHMGSCLVWLGIGVGMGGLTWFAGSRSRRRRRVRERGIASPAQVIAVQVPAELLPGMGLVAVDLWVMPDQGPPFPLSGRMDLLPHQVSRVVPGAVLMVWHLPGEHEFTAVDLAG